MLICAIAVCRNSEVLSNDGGLNRCLAVAKKFAAEDARLRRSFRRVSMKTRKRK